jgi:hypothetical protein
VEPRQLMDSEQGVRAGILWSATTGKRTAKVFIDGDWYILELDDWLSDKETPELVPMSKSPANATLLMDIGELWLMEKRLFEVQADSRKDGVEWKKQDKGIMSETLRYRLWTDERTYHEKAELYDRQEKARVDRAMQLKRGSRRKEIR